MDQLLADEQVHSLSNAAANDVLWGLGDHLNSVRDVVDSAGTVRIHRDFDSFGNVAGETHYNASGATITAGQTGYVDEVFAFTGRFFDKATGLQNNLHRWYDPKVGRWLSEDPIGFAGGDANLYRYVGNSPTWKTDPSGYDGDMLPGWPPQPEPEPRPTPPPLPPPGTVPGPGWAPGPGWDWKPFPNAPGGGAWIGPGGQSLYPDPPHGGKPGHYDWRDPWGNFWEHDPGTGKWKPKKVNPNKPQPLFPPGTLENACAVTGGTLVVGGTIWAILEYGWPLVFAF